MGWIKRKYRSEPNIMHVYPEGFGGSACGVLGGLPLNSMKYSAAKYVVDFLAEQTEEDLNNTCLDCMHTICMN